MSSGRAVFPALPPPSFPSVTLLPASRFTAATVIVPEHTSPDDNDTTIDCPPSVDGNILCIDPAHYFWLQRIVRTTANGKIRAGFCLKPPTTSGSAATTTTCATSWEVEVVHRPSNKNESNTDKNIEAQVQMVAVRIEDATDFMDSPELAALSYVASLAPTAATRFQEDDDDTHVQTAMLIAADESNVYIVTPYDIATSMSLRDYCLAQPNCTVSELQTRDFTKQILKGMATLQNMRLFHGNLTLDNIIVRPNQKRNCSKDRTSTTDDSMRFNCSIRNFEVALRVPCSTATATTTDLENTTPVVVHRLLAAADARRSPTVRRNGMGNVQFVAPEVLSSTSRKDQRKEEKQQQHVPFDAYAVDLWAVGVMILSMLLGNDNVFVAPIVEDRIYQQVSIQEQLKEYYEKIRTTTTTLPTVSDNALDLLQQMLRVDPKDRPTLREIQQHAWFHG